MNFPFRLAHVSDLHFGETFHPKLLQRFANWRRFSSGLEAHDVPVVSSLARSLRFENAELSLQDWMLIASGDLTTWGGSGAFEIAFEYLRGRSNSALPALLPHSLNCPNTPVVPGNHDIWGGKLFGVGGKSPRNVRTSYFTPPSPRLPPTQTFPYALPLSAGVPAVTLYGIDSTEVDAIRTGKISAVGSVSGKQLEDLRAIIAVEPKEEPRLRIAIIHHPLAYKTTPGAGNTKALKNLDEVLNELQNMGIAFALCGHSHHGFIRRMNAVNNLRAPLYVLSVGTATQAVPANATESNEYRIYDFALMPEETEKMQIEVHSFRYGQFGVKQFAEDSTAQQIIHIDLNDYMPL